MLMIVSWIAMTSASGMSAGSMVLAVTLIGFAVWLQHSERRGWAGEQDSPDLSTIDRDYLRNRAKSRRRTNILIGTAGVIVLLTAFVRDPMAWMCAWLLVMLCLMIVIGMAGKDVVRTHRYHRKKLDAIRRLSGTGQTEL